MKAIPTHTPLVPYMTQTASDRPIQDIPGRDHNHLLVETREPVACLGHNG
jgi:hypothetical protein